MDRRGFFRTCGVAAAAVAMPRRAYSFLWQNPVTKKLCVPPSIELFRLPRIFYPPRMLLSPGMLIDLKNDPMFVRFVEELAKKPPILEAAFDRPLFGTG